MANQGITDPNILAIMAKLNQTGASHSTAARITGEEGERKSSSTNI